MMIGYVFKYLGIALLLLVIVSLVSMILSPKINYRSMPAHLCEALLPEQKPNWVSSLVDSNNPHYVAPFKIKSLSTLADCLHSQFPKATITFVQENSHLLAYRQSRVFHFTDWICIKADGHVSSSATMGHSDFGKNREWVEAIRQRCLSNE
jgi:uncharacterized protein (DUF1499 family)